MAYEIDASEGASESLAAFRQAGRAHVAMYGGASVFCHSEKQRLPYVSAGMRGWQADFSAPCGEICCFVDSCGETVCSARAEPLACARGGVTLRAACTPSAHFVCLAPACLGDDCFVCEACFASPRWLHHHTRFVRVTLTGEHAVVNRRVGLGVRRDLSSSAELPRHDASSAPWAGQTCSLCDEQLDGAAPPAFVPGCPARHAGLLAEPSCPPGHFDARPWPTFACASCVFETLRGRNAAFVMEAVGGGGHEARAPCGDCQRADEARAFGGAVCGAKLEARRAWAAAEAAAAAAGEPAAAAARAWAAAAAVFAERLGLPVAEAAPTGGADRANLQGLQRAVLTAYKLKHAQTHIQRMATLELEPCTDKSGACKCSSCLLGRGEDASACYAGVPGPF
jgi:hypothetical protein